MDKFDWILTNLEWILTTLDWILTKINWIHTWNERQYSKMLSSY